MAFEVEILPYDKEALEPRISEETLVAHYSKHYKKYISTLNELVKGTNFEKLSLAEVLVASFHKDEKIFQNSAQAWNHAFYWKCMCPDKTQASRDLRAALVEKFGSLDEFKATFVKAALDLFGSGWVWLLQDDEGELSIEAMSNAGNPLVFGKTPLMVCDVWEHAYYLDCQNDRPQYLDKFWKLINWDFLSENFKIKAPKSETRRANSASVAQQGQIFV